MYLGRAQQGSHTWIPKERENYGSRLFTSSNKRRPPFYIFLGFQVIATERTPWLSHLCSEAAIRKDVKVLAKQKVRIS